MIPSAYGRLVAAAATDRFVVRSLPQGTHCRGFFVSAAAPDNAAARDAMLSVRIAALRSPSEAEAAADVGDSICLGETTADAVRIPAGVQIFIPMDFVIGERSVTAFQVTLNNPSAVNLEAVVCLQYDLPRRKSEEVIYDPLSGR